MRPTSHAQRVYDAETAAQMWSDHGGPIEAFGSTWIVEPTRRFRQLASASTLCNLLTATHGLSPVTVRARKGWQAAHYEPLTATIALPPAIAPWSELLIIHELAHHATRHEPGDHCASFRQALVDLYVTAGLPNLAQLLAIRFAEDDLGYHPPTQEH